MNHTPKQPAYSLIFSFILMTGIMLMAATTIENTREKIEFFSDIEGTVQARIAAESAVDRALAELKNGGLGYEPTDTECDPNAMQNMEGTVTCSEFEVHALGDYQESGSWFHIPILNTGNAGPVDDCKKLNGEIENPDHPCHWNKIQLGQTVTIPLFNDNPENIATCGDDGYPETCNAVELGLSQLNIHLRTPCNLSDPNVTSYSDICAPSERYRLDDGNGLLSEDASIIFWQLIAEEDDDGDPSTEPVQVSLVPDDARGPTLPPSRSDISNTEIYEGLINEALDDFDYEVVNMGSFTDPESFSEVYDFIDQSNYETLYLEMTLVNPLTATDGTYIPYLEWQIKGRSTTCEGCQTPDSKVVITGEGYYKTSSGIFYYPVEIWRSTIEELGSPFTVSN